MFQALKDSRNVSAELTVKNLRVVGAIEKVSEMVSKQVL